MAQKRTHSSKSVDDITEEDWILLISVGLILSAFLLSDLSYYRITQGIRLFFYAVLVRIWTKVGSGIPMSTDRNTAHVEFMLNAIGAVIIGRLIEVGVAELTGTMIAIQSLALAAVLSRLFVNMRTDNVTSLKDIVRYEEDIDRYLVLTPCTVAFLTPIIAYHLNLGVNLDTGRWFLYVFIGSLAIGLGLMYHEKK